MGNYFTRVPNPPETNEEEEKTTGLPSVQEQNSSVKMLEKTFVDIKTLNQASSTSPSLTPANSFSLLSYNILAEVYAHYFSKVIDPKFLDITYRSNLIVQELKDLSSDIICLEEIDNYNRIYRAKLEELGYNTIFEPRKNMRGDGCLIGAKKEKFEIIRHEVFDLDKGHEYEKSPEFIRGNIALFVTLKHKESKKTINVICCHLYWDPKFEHVKYLQMGQILQNVNKLCKSDDIVLWAGDFNSKPRSNLMRYILEGKLPKQKKMEFKDEKSLEIMKTISDKLKTITMKIDWGHAYADYGPAIGNEKISYPEYTNYTMKFKAMIDHILYSKKNLIPRKLLKIPTETEIKTKQVPSKKFPSDHLPLMAFFEII